MKKMLVATAATVLLGVVSMPAHAASKIKAGQFCAAKAVGTTAVATNGQTVRCTKDGARARWK